MTSEKQCLGVRAVPESSNAKLQLGLILSSHSLLAPGGATIKCVIREKEKCEENKQTNKKMFQHIFLGLAPADSYEACIFSVFNE